MSAAAVGGGVTLSPRKAQADTVTTAADNFRTGWYPDQARLSPASVAGPSFGRLFSAEVVGQVYAQPLVTDGVLLVATEDNRVYGLDPETGNDATTGKPLWTRDVGVPWDPKELSCSDLTPHIGITSTPVVDPATHTAYFTAKTYVTGKSGPAKYELHAVNIKTGQERANFPVSIGGAADNDPKIVFNATYELQRPGLLLQDGVIYAAFGAHCDAAPYYGLVAGVDATSGVQTSLWSAAAGPNSEGGAGIWQAGGGLVADRPGSFLVVTGNGDSPPSATKGGPPIVTPGSTPPTHLGESVVRLTVGKDRKLAATDFFAPFDANKLEEYDGDFGAGGPAALPDSMGTTKVPHPLVVAGKGGYVYLLDRDQLGGVGQGAGGSDAVVDRIGPNGGVWSKPAVWPGDGGWVYVPTASGGAVDSGSSGYLRAYKRGVDGTGKPALSLAATSTTPFGFGSSIPVVTSDGTTNGSALVWIIWSPAGDGVNAQLRAYDAVPVDGDFRLRFSAPIGTSTKFTPPGVGNGRIYVGTRDGHVLAYGAPVQQSVTVAGTDLGVVTVGTSATTTITLTAQQDTTITSLGVKGSGVAVGSGAPALPVNVVAGKSLDIPVVFTPALAAPVGGTLTVGTSDGNFDISLNGTGRAKGPALAASTKLLSLGGIAVNRALSGNFTLTNTGDAALTVQKITAPDKPFTLTGAPAVNSLLAPGASITVGVSFTATKPGDYSDDLIVATTGGTATVGVTASASLPGILTISPEKLAIGTVAVGSSVSKIITLSNTGGSTLTLNKSKVPLPGPLTVDTALPEGTTIAAGAQLPVTVTFTPTVPGDVTANLELTADDGQNLRTVALSGSGIPQVTTLGQPLGSSVLLSKGATVTTSSTESAQLGPEKALDGDVSTRWSSAFDDNQSITVDLGAEHTVKRVVLSWETAFGKTYEVQGSLDGKDWSTLSSVASGNGGVDDLQVAASKARYVRVLGTKRGTVWGYSLYELEVYGS